MYGLIESNQNTRPEKRVMNLEIIAKYYAAWVHAGPFDSGLATMDYLRDEKNVDKIKEKCSK